MNSGPTRTSRRRLALILIAICVCSALALAQRFGSRFQEDSDDGRPQFPAKGEFHFIRMEYTDLPQYHRGWGFASRDGRGSGWWIVDWPESEDHFSVGVRRLTRVDTGKPLTMRITDPRIFDNPWLYATQTGWWGLSKAETDLLREYLLRGGFLVTDDFFGDEAWSVFRSTMARVLPGQPISDIAPGDSVMHVLYDIQEKDLTFIPGSRHLRRAPGGKIVVEQPYDAKSAWRAMYDPKDRMVVAANYNTDVGDAWEFADVPYYPEHMTELAYHYGINYLIYAMTH